MVAFNNTFLKSVFLAITIAGTQAAPGPSSSRVTVSPRSTHKLSTIGKRTIASRQDTQFQTYNPPSTYETYGSSGQSHRHAGGDVPIEEATVDFVTEKLGVDKSSVGFRVGANKSVGKVGFVTQTFNGIPIANAVANVAFNEQGQVSSFSSSFVDTGATPASFAPGISNEEAIAAAEAAVSGQHNGQEPTLEYLVKSDGSLALTRVVQVRAPQTFVEVYVDTTSSEIVQVNSFTNEAVYNVLPITKQIAPEGLETIEDPEDLEASPNGWIVDGVTAGPNAIAFTAFNQANGTAPQTGTDEFIYQWNNATAPTTEENKRVATVNAFYITNTIHDFAFRYGFTPETFNFEDEDRVLVNVQDSRGRNNAWFDTPPDGQSGEMAMFLWSLTTPNRDGSLENDIIVHEMTHGITNRMTGGGTGRCLETDEAGGMGEGWSDALAEWTELKGANITDFTLGAWVTERPGGIRTHPYSVDPAVNPLTYASIGELNEVHAIGEVWANILHQVSADLLAQYGFSAEAKTNPDGTEGNVVWLHLFLDALLIQPCNPTLLSARDAWIQADADRYAGANKCLLWKAFASKGLGEGAADFKDSTAVPEGC